MTIPNEILDMMPAEQKAIVLLTRERNELQEHVDKLTAQRDALLGSISQIFAYLGDVKIADYNIVNEELSAMCSSALAVFAPVTGGGHESIELSPEGKLIAHDIAPAQSRKWRIEMFPRRVTPMSVRQRVIRVRLVRRYERD